MKLKEKNDISNKLFRKDPMSTSKTVLKRVPGRMPCKKYIYVAGMQESRTLSTNQFVNAESE
jgi:hypothetical protein